jgi:hypothetical protein
MQISRSLYPLCRAFSHSRTQSEGGQGRCSRICVSLFETDAPKEPSLTRHSSFGNCQLLNDFSVRITIRLFSPSPRGSPRTCAACMRQNKEPSLGLAPAGKPMTAGMADHSSLLIRSARDSSASDSPGQYLGSCRGSRAGFLFLYRQQGESVTGEYRAGRWTGV